MSAKRRILPLFIPHLGCPHNCVFCNQKCISGARCPVTPEDVAAALAAAPGEGYEAAFYGGSFTAIPAQQQTALLQAAEPFIASGKVCALRVSTRPDCIDADALSLLRRFHVGTVELGAQSMDDTVLRESQRGHSAADTERAAALIRGAGLDLGLQMMTGLPGSSDGSDVETARRLIALRPDAVRIYPTVILRSTPLYDMWQQGRYREHTVEDAVRVCAEILPLFEAAHIPVIRLGLNPTDDLSGGEAAGGAYHPALGELVRSRVYLNRARALLQGTQPGSRVTLGVAKGRVSQMTGQHRCNIETLCREFRLGDLAIAETEIGDGEITLLEK